MYACILLVRETTIATDFKGENAGGCLVLRGCDGFYLRPLLTPAPRRHLPEFLSRERAAREASACLSLATPCFAFCLVFQVLQDLVFFLRDFCQAGAGAGLKPRKPIPQ
jgi:hypothetical protein